MASGPVRTTAPSAGRGTGPSRRQRSDAKRNVVALVEAAKTVFAGSGVNAPAKEITDLAGVGVGTLYRHFPRRSDLIVAVLQHEIDECVEAAEELGTTLDPWEALTGWIERFTDFVATKRGLASALHSGDPAYDDLPQHLLDRLEPALQTLLARAADGGYARDDVTGREVLTTIALICQPVPDEPPSFNQRMTQVFMEGLGRTGAVDRALHKVKAGQSRPGRRSQGPPRERTETIHAMTTGGTPVTEAGITMPVPESSSMQELRAFVDRCHVAITKQSQGHPESFLELWSHADDVTIMAAIGGYQTGFDAVRELLTAASKTQQFDGWRAENVATVLEENLAFTVELEHYTHTGDRENKGMTLRATQIYRREEGQWRVIHRHGDILAPIEARW